MPPSSQFLLNSSHFRHQFVELVVDVLWAPLHKLLNCLLSVGVPLDGGNRDLLVRFVLPQHLEADSEALRLCVVEQELAQIHVTSACADKHSTALDLNSSDFRAHEISSS